jgi:hypothetical protein
MKITELAILGLVVFIAIVVSDMWMERQRDLIAKALIDAQNRVPTVIQGFASSIQ